MRHGDINLTMNRYTHTLTGQEAKAVAELPDLSTPNKQNQKATGTNDLTPEIVDFEDKTTSRTTSLDEDDYKPNDNNTLIERGNNLRNRRLGVRILSGVVEWNYLGTSLRSKMDMNYEL